MHFQQAADPIFRPLRHIQDRGSGLEHSGIHPKIGELPGERIGHDLKCERRKRFVIRRTTQHLLPRIRIDALHGRDIKRRGQVIDNRIEQLLHALVLEGGTAEDRDDFDGNSPDPDHAMDLLLGQRLTIQVLFHDVVVEFSHSFKHLLPIFLGLVEHICGNLVDLILGAKSLVIVEKSLHSYEIDRAAKLAFPPDRNLNGYRVCPKPINDRLHAGEKVGPDTIHLIHECDARNTILVRLPPNRFGLRLDSLHGIEHGNRAVKDPQGSLNLDGEVYVTGSIDDIDAVIFPETGRCGRGNGNPAFPLLFHPVHRGSTLMYLTHLMGQPRVVQNALGRRCLAGINVSHDADIARTFERCLPSHYTPSKKQSCCN